MISDAVISCRIREFGMLICRFNWFFFRGQAEQEFKVEVESIGRVRHKHLTGLIGYCAEGPKR